MTPAPAPDPVSRVRMALAEAGYPDPALVVLDPGSGRVLTNSFVIPTHVRWRAYATAAPETTCCWACFEAVTGETCTHPVRLSDAPLPGPAYGGDA